MSNCLPTLPRRLDGFTPYSTNPNYPNAGEFEPVLDFVPGQKYIQIDTNHYIVNAAIRSAFFHDERAQTILSERHKRKITKTSDYLRSNLLGEDPEIAFFIKPSVDELDISSDVLLFQRGHFPERS